MIRPDIKVFDFETTDSTNTRAREYVRSGRGLPALFTAKGQTAGRGRKGRSFYSPADTGLYMTLALPWDESVKNNVALTCAVSVAAARALERFTDKTLTVKWVNDLLADGKKVAGILCETVADPSTNEINAVLIGIGVNLTTTVFPDDIGQSVTCLSDSQLDRQLIARELTDEFFNVIYSEDRTSVMEEYRRLSAVIGRDIYYIKDGNRYDAKAVDINENGGLEVLHPDNTKAMLTSGEISLRLKPE